jgi:uncharacterized FlgJ-related protein
VQEKKYKKWNPVKNSMQEYLMSVFVTFCYTVHLRWAIPVIIERIKPVIWTTEIFFKSMGRGVGV